jgi:spermidine synthase
MEIKLIKAIDHNDFIALYKDAGWWKCEYNKDLSFIDQVVNGSFLFAAAFDDNGQMVGMGRVLSDGCSDAYIQDVVVLKKHRRTGIGKLIITFLINELKGCGVDWIGLIGEPGTEKFYSGLGFKTMPEYLPMKFSDS